MFLKSVELFGFKSFAVKTKVEFSDGTTAIVGPNGCGKTNIVDAVRWVLGEQKASVLRSEKMENVIFNGSATRKPMGMSEVSLRIKNTKNLLPVEFSEVLISRRLYRSGESEYYLNRNQCRLKDIIDLFIDTGMSSDAYSVIELKMIESILSDKTEDRRKLFEEAAGVSKFKQRKAATLRKLDTVKQDLIRINDIIIEVERKVNSLRRQAAKARKFLKMKNEIKEKETTVLKFKYNHLKEIWKPKEDELLKIKDKIEGLRGKQSLVESEIEKLKLNQVEEEKEYEKSQKNYNEVSNNLRECEGKLNSNREKKNYTNSRISYLKEDLVQIKNKIGKIDENLEKLEEEKSEISISKTELFSEKQELDSEFEDLLIKYNKFKSQLNGLRNENLRIVKLISEKERIKDKILRDFSEREEKLEKIDEESSTLKKKIYVRNQELEKLYRDKEIRENILKKTYKNIRETDQSINEKEKDLIDSQEKLYKTKIIVENYKAKLEFLNNLIQNVAGSSEGEKFLLKKRESINGLHGTVSELISVDKKYEKAVETALGESGSYLIFETINEAKNAIAELRKAKGGKATIIPLDRISNVDLKNRIIKLPSNNLIYGWANDLIQTDQKYKKALDFLLENVLIVNDSEEAFKKINFDFKREVKFVDVNGDMLKGDGVIRGGSHSEKKEPTIGKGKEIQNLKSKIKNTEVLLENTTKEKDRITEEIQALKSKKSKVNEGKLNEEKIFKEIEREIIILENEIKRDHDILGKITGEKDQLELFKMEETDLVKLNNEIISYERSKEEIEQKLKEFNKKETSLENKRKDFQEKIHKIELEILKNNEIYSNILKELERLSTEKKLLFEESKNKETETEKLKKEIIRLSDEIVEFEKKIDKLFENLKLCEEEIDTKRNLFVNAKVLVDDKEKILKESRQQLNQSMDKMINLEHEISENKTEWEILKRKLDEYKVTDFSIDEDINIKQLEDEVIHLKVKLDKVGLVNLVAEEDYQEEKERLEFLRKQQSDITEAEKNLIETIDKINTAAIGQFKETFENIRQNFIEVYNIFFEKGEADIRLINEDEPLESPIGILSRPFGKKLMSTNQLSAGEKALTAIALLFGIYKVKPSPFCILDEVDAPLDESNTQRFLGALDTFSKDTQFIIVTHNKLTMERSNSLYGITMEETGVSKVVSVKLN